MRHTIALACAAIIGLTALAERAEALIVADAYHYLDLRQNSNGSLDPRLPMFISLRDVDGDITSPTVEVSGPAAGTYPMINFGPFLGVGETEPILEYGRIWRTSNDDLTPFAQSSFTMSVTDNSGTVTAEVGPLIGLNETAIFLPLVSDVTVSDSSTTPTISWTNPADMTGVDEIVVRVVDTVADTFFTEVYREVITDLSTTSITIPESFLFAGDFQLRVELRDQEVVTDILNGVERTSERNVSRSTNISDITVVALPLPGTAYILLAGLAAFGWLGRKSLLAKSS